MPRSFASLLTWSRRATASSLVAGLLGLGLAGCLALVVWTQVKPGCDVRDGAYTVNVEVQGWGAESICHQLTAGSSHWTESAVDGPAVCEEPYKGYTLVIHDPAGGFEGALVCAVFEADRTLAPLVAPSPSPGTWAVRY